MVARIEKPNLRRTNDMSQLTDRQRMNRMALHIPKNYEYKDAEGNPTAALKEEILAAVREYKETTSRYVKDLLEKNAVGSDTIEKMGKIMERMDDLEAKFRKPSGGDGDAPLSKTIAQMFLDSEEFGTWKKRGWHKGGCPMEFKTWFEEPTLPQIANFKTTITTSTVGTAMDQSLRVPGILMPMTRELRIRDLLPVSPTTVPTIEYVKENVFTNAASPQVEGSAKAEAALTFTLASATVRTIAHWIPATRQVLDDMGQLMNYIQIRLRYGLKLVEEQELLSGDGTGQHLNGLITQATAYETSRNISGDTPIDKLSHAMTQARVAEFPVDGVVLHPNDWEKIRLVKTDEGTVANHGAYVFGNPGQMVQPTLWNAPIVVTTAITSGTFLVGAFALGAEIFDRQQATIDISTEHASFFTENKVAIRAEERIALAVYRPSAFVTGSF
jgi:HK97 family phage major capsid protein